MHISIPKFVLSVSDFKKAQTTLNDLIRQEECWKMQLAASLILRAFWDNPHLEKLIAYDDGTRNMALSGFFAEPLAQQDAIEHLDEIASLGLELEFIWQLYDKPFSRNTVVEQVKKTFYRSDWAVDWEDFLNCHMESVAA